MTISNRETKTLSDLASWIKSIGDEKLGRILANREDVLHPIPPGSTSLAVRLQLPGSIRPAFSKLSVFDFAVIEKTIALGGKTNPLSAPEIAASLGSQPELPSLVETSLEKLTDFALVYGTPSSFLLTEGVAAQFEHVPIRLPEPDAPSAEEISVRLAEIDERQRKILDTVMLSGGTGITKDAAADADPTRPIPQLIASGLLTRVSESVVAIPRSVRAVLSGAPVPTSFLPPSVSDHTELASAPEVSGTALETVRGVRDLVEYVGRNPIALLRDGAVGVRNLGSTTKDLRNDKEDLYPLFTLALQAGLLGTGVPRPRPDEDELKNYLAPTGMLDEFVELTLAQQWAYLVACWFEYSSAKPWAIGLPGRMEAGKPKAVRLLDKEMKDSSLPLVRKVLLEIVGRAPLTRKELRNLAAYERPLVIAHRSEEDINGVIDEAISLGVLAETTHLHPTPVLRGLLGQQMTELAPITAITDEGKAVQSFEAYHALVPITEELTPAEVDQFIMQADMTVLVPGPMPRPLQVELALLADLESAGMASVYRITEESLARGFEAGRSDQEIIGFFTRHSMSEVPQSLNYLVNDLARRHGTVRAGTALSYVTSKDPDALAPVAQNLGLRLLAPTVAISHKPLPELMNELKASGLNPAAENEDGISIDIRPEPARVRFAPAPRRADPSHDRVLAAIAKIRELDGNSGGVFTENFHTVIQKAIKEKHDLKLTLGEDEITVSPIDVRMGRLSAVNADTADLVSISLKEITEITW